MIQEFFYCWTLVTEPTGCPETSVINYHYCTVLYCTALYCTVLCFTVLYCTLLHCTVLYCTALYCNMLHCTALYSTVLYCTELYYSPGVNQIAVNKYIISYRIKFSPLFTPHDCLNYEILNGPPSWAHYTPKLNHFGKSPGTSPPLLELFLPYLTAVCSSSTLPIKPNS